MRVRCNIEQLTLPELNVYRDVVAQAQAILDNRGYGYFAGIHGWPQERCHHDTNTGLFLPWHRAYLYFFELALAELNTEAAIPWWDWTAPADLSGIPQAFHAPINQGGPRNPLADAELHPEQLSPARLNEARQTRTLNIPAGGLPQTFRLPRDMATLQRYTANINEVLASQDFFDFSSRIQDIHDGVHEWVGGTMGTRTFAAFDPIFWSHHAMIDRLWYLWQLDHPGALPPRHPILGRVLDGFTITVADTLDINKRLGYGYARKVVAEVVA
jgi:tyrosinase